MNVVPRPVRVRHSTLPPCSSAIRFTADSNGSRPLRIVRESERMKRRFLPDPLRLRIAHLTGPLVGGRLLAVPLILGLLAYWRSIDGEFVFDDSNTIVNHFGIRDLWGFLRVHFLAGYLDSGRPVTDLTFAMNYAYGGLDTRAYHLTNVALHLAAVVLIFFLTKRVLARVGWPTPERLSLAIAGAFALHPLHSQAVSYLSQRSEVLASVGYLATLLLLFEAEERGIATLRGASAFGAALVVFVLALGAKTIAVTLPCAYLLCSWAFPAAASPLPGGARHSSRSRLQMAAPFLALSVLFAARQISSVRGSRHAGFDTIGMDPWRYLLTQFRVLLTYLRLVAWPSGLNFDRAFPPSAGILEPRTMMSALAVSSMVAAALLLFRWSHDKGPGRIDAAAARLAAVGYLWFLLVLAPTSSVVPIFDVIEEHRVYLASWGILLAGGAAGALLIARVRGRGIAGQYASWIVTAAVWLVLAYGLDVRNAVYQDNVSLWRDAVSKSPGKARPHFSLAHALDARGDHESALTQYQEALPLASDLSVSRLDVVRNMSASLLELGRIEESSDLLQPALRVYPGHPELLNNLALTYMRKKDFEMAVRVARQAVSGAPGVALHHITLGQALVGAGDPSAALREYSAGMTLGFDDPQTAFEFAMVEGLLGMRRESCDGFKRVATVATGRLRAAALERGAGCNAY